MKQPVEARRSLTLLPLVATTYFMVAGGPYGLEELIAPAGFDLAILVLLVTPIIWSLPTALMVGELAGAIPEEGGYYAWVRRALGPFGGFMEAWLSLVASIFDMAIYPTLFVLYLSRLWPALSDPVAGSLVGAALIGVCAAWNIGGARAVGGGAVAMTVVLLAPFAVIVVLAPFSTHINVTPTHASHGGIVAGILVAMWNYMGWDNASTIAGEVDRPQRTYPLAMLLTVTLVALTYVLPVVAVRSTGVDPSGWTTGAWVNIAEAIGGRALGTAVVLGGVVCAAGMLNALVLSYSRLPMVLARDGYLPPVFARLHPKTGAPWVSILACAVAYTLALRLGFQRLIELDVMLYGASLMLEFVALIVLRVREPQLARPFRIPGGLPGVVAITIPPAVLIAIALAHGHEEQAGPISALALGVLLMLAGPLVYGLMRLARARLTVEPAG